ncbi:AAA family ATPase [Salinimicrobium soli]|uniref:AAA family ATPase n=1 Tax=Salinimicrobium soli TaxID=1254399 RepID=UPI003AAC4EC0
MSGHLQKTSAAITEPIFGRNRELKLLSEGLLNAGTSGTSLFIFKGPAGVGKTTLIKKALESYPHDKCFKLYGKFENHRENAPYSAFKQAFSSWAQQILLLSDEEFDSVKESATSALQTNITAVTGVFDELEVFFSRKNLVRDHYAFPHQLKARFYYFLKKFLRSITGLGYHLLIFLDDLQWCDKASLLLLEELIKSNDIPGLIFIAASREAEENSAINDPLSTIFKNKRNVTFIPLKPLSRNSVGAMVPSQWRLSKQNLEDFQNYLWLESAGNPFRINEILKIIQKEGLAKIRPEDPAFWEHLPRLGSAEDSVSFIQEQLRSLPFHQLQVIATASCLGYSFNIDLLKEILTQPEKEIVYHLRDLVKMDLLIRKRNIFLFSHDTIFSAANSLLSNAEKSDVHQRTGHYLLQKLNTYENQDFFRAVNHLNKAYELTSFKNENLEENILLNIHAARLAINNTAFEVAHNYYVAADKLSAGKISFIKVSDPKLVSIFKTEQMDHDTVQFLIHFGYAETSFLLLKFEAALESIGQALKMNCTRHQRLQATLIKMMICSALIHQKNIPHILNDGFESLERTLAEYGIVIPSDHDSIKKESAVDCSILSRKAAELDMKVRFSEMINPDQEYQDLMNLVATSMTFVYYMDPHKSLFMVSKTLLLTLEKGFAPVTPVLFSASFFTAFFSEENRSLAHFLGKVSLKMIENDPFKRFSYMVHYVAILNFYTWEHHYRDCVVKLKEGAQQATEAGDSHYAAFCHTIVRVLDSYRGKNLQEHLEYSERNEKDHHVFFISGTDNSLSQYLTGQIPGFETGDFIFPEEILVESEHNLTCRYNHLLALEKLNYIGNFIEAAVLAGESCDRLEYVGKGFQIEVEHFFFYSLSLLQSAYHHPVEFSEAMDKVAPKLEELERLAGFRSGNFLHKVYLVKAEIAKCKGDFEQATLLYDLAIEEARDKEFVHHAAIAAERAFEYYRDKKRNGQAIHYLKKSLKLYTAWGATAKVEQLKKLYKSVIPEKIPSSSSPHSHHPFEVIREVLEQTIPGNQISLTDLSKKLVSLILKEGNAGKAAILFSLQNSWKVLALAPNGEDLVNKPLHELRANLPVSILNYGIKKGEKIILQDFSKESLFVADPYLQKEIPGNICIFPVRESGETIGLIYLEDCPILTETERDLFLLTIELISTTFANAVYHHNNDLLNKELKLQEKNRIEAVIESQEKERQRIARDLHDSLGQILALSRINLSRINLKSTDTQNQLLLNEIVGLIDESCREVRNISHNLMPPDLDNKSLPEILESLINKNRQTNGVEYIFHSHSLREDLSVAGKFTLYRVLQEILQNIIKHASATKVTITLMHNNEFTNLLVEDNGKGFDTGLASLGIGLKNIHSRIKVLHGYFDIDSSINKGTVFNVSIPLTV